MHLFIKSLKSGLALVLVLALVFGSFSFAELKPSAVVFLGSFTSNSPGGVVLPGTVTGTVYKVVEGQRLASSSTVTVHPRGYFLLNHAEDGTFEVVFQYDDAFSNYILATEARFTVASGEVAEKVFIPLAEKQIALELTYKGEGLAFYSHTMSLELKDSNDLYYPLSALTYQENPLIIGGLPEGHYNLEFEDLRDGVAYKQTIAVQVIQGEILRLVLALENSSAFSDGGGTGDTGDTGDSGEVKKPTLTLSAVTPTGEAYTNLSFHAYNDASKYNYSWRAKDEDEGLIHLESMDFGTYAVKVFANGPEGYVVKDAITVVLDEAGWHLPNDVQIITHLEFELEQGVLLATLAGPESVVNEENYRFILVRYEDHKSYTYCVNDAKALYISDKHTGSYLLHLYGYSRHIIDAAEVITPKSVNVTLLNGVSEQPVSLSFDKIQLYLPFAFEETEHQKAPVGHLRDLMNTIQFSLSLSKNGEAYTDYRWDPTNDFDTIALALLEDGRYTLDFTFSYRPYDLDKSLTWEGDIAFEVVSGLVTPNRQTFLLRAKVDDEADESQDTTGLTLAVYHEDETTHEKQYLTHLKGRMISESMHMIFPDPEETEEGLYFPALSLPDGKYIYKIEPPAFLAPTHGPIYYPLEVVEGEIVQRGRVDIGFELNEPSLVVDAKAKGQPYVNFAAAYRNSDSYIDHMGTLHDLDLQQVGNKLYIRFRGDVRTPLRLQALGDDLFAYTEQVSLVSKEGQLFINDELAVSPLTLVFEEGVKIGVFQTINQNALLAKDVGVISLEKLKEQGDGVAIKADGSLVVNPLEEGAYQLFLGLIDGVLHYPQYFSIDSKGALVGEAIVVENVHDVRFEINPEVEGWRRIYISTKTPDLLSRGYSDDVLKLNGFLDGCYSFSGTVYDYREENGFHGRINNFDDGEILVQQGVYTLHHKDLVLSGLNLKSGLSILAQERPEATALLNEIDRVEAMDLTGKTPVSVKGLLDAVDIAKVLFNAPQEVATYVEALSRIEDGIKGLKNVNDPTKPPTPPTIPPTTSPEPPVQITPPAPPSLPEQNQQPASTTTPANTLVIEEKETPKGALTFKGSYLNGYGDGTFRPEASVTRAEFAKMLATVLMLDMKEKAALGDVSEKDWYAGPIQALIKSGIQSADDKGNFRPNDAITRAEIVEAIVNYWSFIGKDVQAKSIPFTDVTGAKMIERVGKVYAEGIISGFGDNTFKPHALATRAQAIKMINMLIGRLPLAVTHRKMSFSDLPATHWAFGMIEAAVAGE